MKDTILPIDTARLARFAHDTEVLLEGMRTCPCETPEQEAWWANMLNTVQKEIKDLDAERENLVRPLIRDKRAVDEAFKAATTPAETLKALIKKKLAYAAERRLAAQNEARAQAQAAAVVGDVATAAAAIATIPADIKPKGVGTQWVWDYSITDASLVPREFLSVDGRAIEKFAKAFVKEEEIPSIPGIEFRRSARLSVRGTK